MEKKKWYQKAWQFLDGKKTTIGTVMLIAANFVKPYTVAYQVLSYGGTLLGGTGIIHKAQKKEFNK